MPNYYRDDGSYRGSSGSHGKKNFDNKRRENYQSSTNTGYSSQSYNNGDQSRGNAHSSTNTSFLSQSYNNSSQSMYNPQSSTNTGYLSQSYNNDGQISNTGYHNGNNQPMANYGGYSNNAAQNSYQYNNSNMSNQSMSNQSMSNQSMSNQSMSNQSMSNQSVPQWSNGSQVSYNNNNDTNNVGYNYNVNSYSNNVMIGQSPITAINQITQFGQSGMGQNSLTMGIMEAVNNVGTIMGTNINQRNYDTQQNRNGSQINYDVQQDGNINRGKRFFAGKQKNRNKRSDRSERYARNDHSGVRSQTLVTVKKQIKKDTNFSFKNKPTNSIKDRIGNKNGNKPLKRLGNNFNKPKLDFRNDKFEKNKIESKKEQNPKVIKEENKKNSKDDKITECKKETTEGSIENESNTKHCDIPIEYLKCHMCNFLHFKSVGHYTNHLKSKKHGHMAQIYHAKCMTTLQLLRLDAALASQRIMDKSPKVGASKILECYKCQCRIHTNMQTHIKTIEHSLVANYTNVKCCGGSFNNRGEYEEHKLSLIHLKQVGEMVEKSREKKENELEDIKLLGLEDKTFSEQQKALHEEVKETIKDIAAEEGVYSLSKFPPYDSQKAIGSKYMVTKFQYQCRVCIRQFEPRRKVIETHCRSNKHYLNVLKFLMEEDLKKKNSETNEKEGETETGSLIKEKSSRKKGLNKKNLTKKADSLKEENAKERKGSESIEDIENYIQGHDTQTETDEENIKDEEKLVVNEAETDILKEGNKDDASSDNQGKEKVIDKMDTADVDHCDVEKRMEEDDDWGFINEEYLSEAEEENKNDEINKEQDEKEKRNINCLKENSISTKNLEVLTNKKLNDEGSHLDKDINDECKNEEKNITSAKQNNNKGAKKDDCEAKLLSIAKKEERVDVNNDKVTLKRQRKQNKKCSMDSIHEKEEAEDSQVDNEEEVEHKSKSKRAKIADKQNEVSEFVSNENTKEITEKNGIDKERVNNESDKIYEDKNIHEKECDGMKEIKTQEVEVGKESAAKTKEEKTTEEIDDKVESACEDENNEIVEKKKVSKGKEVTDTVKIDKNNKINATEDKVIIKATEKIIEDKELNEKNEVSIKLDTKDENEFQNREIDGEISTEQGFNENEKESNDKETKEKDSNKKKGLNKNKEVNDKKEINKNECNKKEMEEKEDKVIEEVIKEATAEETETLNLATTTRRSRRRKSQSQ
ncbi:unnamed protein product [Meganyctiphanes norvegica]|uniref:Matrin-type domain-containing protein n=1 Tax=Meganyctiphanes norvegica TaxID=48144 RepID=A0AAV2SSG7_MEGNR